MLIIANYAKILAVLVLLLILALIFALVLILILVLVLAVLVLRVLALVIRIAVLVLVVLLVIVRHICDLLIGNIFFSYRSSMSFLQKFMPFYLWYFRTNFFLAFLSH